MDLAWFVSVALQVLCRSEVVRGEVEAANDWVPECPENPVIDNLIRTTTPDNSLCFSCNIHNWN